MSFLWVALRRLLRHRRFSCHALNLGHLQAPVRMLGHSLFVAVALTGLKLLWDGLR
mgnify:CR=1 FL=1